MKFSDETLMAYADGELDEQTRSAVERAIRSDPAIAAKVRRHVVMRSNVFAAFAPIADEPVPQRLSASAKPGKVIHLNTARIARVEAVHEKRRWSWREWGGIAGALMVGVLVGIMGTVNLWEKAPLAAKGGAGGALRAQGVLAEALSRQLAGTSAAGSGVRIGVSFEAKGGGYCRSFMTGAIAGLACRNGAEWKVPVVAEVAKGASGQYWQDGTGMPAVILEAIDARIAGRTLDAKAEQAARERGWSR